MDSDTGLAAHLSKTSSTFSSIYKNFKQEEEFGWFLPSPNDDIIQYYEEDNDKPHGPYKQAAVMFLLAEINESLHVLLTKRSTLVRLYKGQDCLPGGTREPWETSPVQTALREAQEETGLDPNLVTVLSVAPPFMTGIGTLTAVSPVVCVLNTDPKNLKLTPYEKEVDCIYWMPIRVFLESETLEHVSVHFSPLNQNFVTAGFHFDSKTTGQHHFVWGLTARICVTLSAIALDEAPAYPCSENNAISSILSGEEGKLKVISHDIALTSTHREEWKDCPNINSNILPIDKWTCTIKSKL